MKNNVCIALSAGDAAYAKLLRQALYVEAA